MEAKQLAQVTLESVNNMAFDNKAFAEAILRSHRTLQQSVFRMFFTLVMTMAEKGTADLRNQDSLDACKAIVERCPEQLALRFI